MNMTEIYGFLVLGPMRENRGTKLRTSPCLSFDIKKTVNSKLEKLGISQLFVI